MSWSSDHASIDAEHTCFFRKQNKRRLVCTFLYSSRYTMIQLTSENKDTSHHKYFTTRRFDMISCCHKQLNTTRSLQRFHKHNRKCSYSQSSVICFFKQLAAPIQMLVCRAPHHYRCSPPEIRKSPVHIGQGTSTNGHRGCQYRTLFKPSHQCCSSLRSVPFCRGAGVGQRRFLCPQNGTG